MGQRAPFCGLNLKKLSRADDIYFFYYFSEKIRLDIAYESSAKQKEENDHRNENMINFH